MSIGQMPMQVAILAAWFVVPFVVSLRIFRWR
jgi:hypothetical protein